MNSSSRGLSHTASNGQGDPALADSSAADVEPCARCKAAYSEGRPEYFGDDPACAFPGGGHFITDNWQCATADLIRDLVGEFPGDVEKSGISVMQDWGQKVATVVIHDGIDLDGHDEYIPALVVSWYKRRGGTDTMLLITDDGRSILPTAADIEAICAGYAALPDQSACTASDAAQVAGESSRDDPKPNPPTQSEGPR